MNERSLPLLPLGVLILLALLTFWLSRYVDAEGARGNEMKRHDPDVVIEQFTAQKLSPTGDVQYVVVADKMTHYPDDDSSILEKIVFTATVPGRPTVTARAPLGRLTKGGDEVAMDGGVVLDSGGTGRSPAMQMRTPKLTIFPDKSLARSTDGVVIESVQGVMHAAKFELNSATNILTLDRVKATLRRDKPDLTDKSPRKTQ